ncbi:MAG: hypothetical protein H6510_18015 [Acidobacteria bacterium]|nr:hypothetical protein [Acidobacteriota bacterium]MCB9399714.1 hypothetical protein [Acidobacteriota bacterium]
MEVKTGGHIDQMLRQTRAHHVQLSSMADFKANILMTMSSVVLTLSIRYIGDPLLRWPIFILMAFCMLTLVLAVYAIMPKAVSPPHHHKKPDLHDSHFNLLFFGSFTELSFEDYREAMWQAIHNPEETYELMIREVYQLGQFLARKKYRYVRLAYISFLSGFLISGLVMAILMVVTGEVFHFPV